MSDEKVATPQEYYKGFPEAPFSDTFKWTDADGYEHMITARSWSATSLMGAVSQVKEQITKVDGAPAGKFAPKSETVTRQPIDDNGNEMPQIFKGQAGRLSVEMKDGKYSYKIEDALFQQGRKGSKFGVRVWPEVLVAVGLGVNDDGSPAWGNPPTPPVISGWAFEYVENEKGYPQKVTRLLPPK